MGGRKDQGFWQCHLLIHDCSEMRMGSRSFCICFQAFQMFSSLQYKFPWPIFSSLSTVHKYSIFKKYCKSRLLHMEYQIIRQLSFRTKVRYTHLIWRCLNLSLLYLAMRTRSGLDTGLERLPSSISFTDVSNRACTSRGRSRRARRKQEMPSYFFLIWKIP